MRDFEPFVSIVEFESFKIILEGDDSIVNDAISSKVEEVYNDYFVFFNNIILEGTYCKSPTFFEHVKIFEEKFIEEKLNFSNYQSERSLSFFTSILLIGKFYEEIEESLKILIKFIDSINSKLEFQDNKIYLNISSKDRIIDFDLLDEEESSYLKFFRINLFVAYCDHFLSNNNIFLLNKLEDVIDVLKKSSQFSNSKKLTYKARYLRVKILLRDALKEKKKSKKLIYVINEGSVERLNPELNFHDLNRYFGKWIIHLIDHYQLESNSLDNIDERFNALSISSGSIGNISEVHLRIKYFKDVGFIEESIKKLITYLEGKKDSNSLCFFDRYAFSVSITYAINNYFSLLNEDRFRSKNATKIHSEYIELNQKIEGLNNKNYFLHFKYLNFLLWELEEKIESENTNTNVFEHLDDIKQQIAECGRIITLYKENISWVNTNYNYVFQLPFEDCLIDFDSTKLFVFSSFVLPIERDEMIQDFEKNKARLETIKSSVKIYLSLRTLHQSNVELKKENERKDSKNIEILGLFVAIVTFTAGIIPGFKFIDSGVEAVFFTLALGISMSSFAITLIVITRNQINLLRKFITVVVFLLSVWFLWYLAYFPLNKEFTNNRKLELNENNFQKCGNKSED